MADVINSGEQVLMHAYTYSAHPVGCRVALAMLDIIDIRKISLGKRRKRGNIC